MSPRTYSNRYRRKPKTKAMSQWDGWGWSMFFGQLIIAFGFLIFGLTHFAFASPGGMDTNRSPFSAGRPSSGSLDHG